MSHASHTASASRIRENETRLQSIRDQAAAIVVDCDALLALDIADRTDEQAAEDALRHKLAGLANS